MPTLLTLMPDGLYAVAVEEGGKTSTFMVAREFIEQTLGVGAPESGAALAPEQLDKLARACRDAAVPLAEDLVFFSPEPTKPNPK
ncbi:hypothetical protein [Crenobacter cavernae]|nr:hypothetical protein [Crenobacter cavernae]